MSSVLHLFALATCAAVAVAAVAQTRPEVPDTLGQRLQACTTCHGKEGVATPQGYFPRIAGKPARYLYNQLVGFREGRRSNAAMAHLLENMSDTYLVEIAAYYATLDLPYRAPESAPVDARVLDRGRVLVQQGDGASSVPACISCHGEALTGVQPSVPGLLGLRREYLLAQFGGWRTGQRLSTAPDCMREISLRISESDLGAVAAYLSLQVVPKASRPIDSIRLPLPMECGSVLR